MVNIILFVLFFREKMEALFNQLKRELLSPDNTMEDSFNLLNELRIATERNFALKKMFWKV
jgi:predicted component of type VI protein secretion system